MSNERTDGETWQLSAYNKREFLSNKQPKRNELKWEMNVSIPINSSPPLSLSLFFCQHFLRFWNYYCNANFWNQNLKKSWTFDVFDVERAHFNLYRVNIFLVIGPSNQSKIELFKFTLKIEAKTKLHSSVLWSCLYHWLRKSWGVFGMRIEQASWADDDDYGDGKCVCVCFFRGSRKMNGGPNCHCVQERLQHAFCKN